MGNNNLEFLGASNLPKESKDFSKGCLVDELPK